MSRILLIVSLLIVALESNIAQANLVCPQPRYSAGSVSTGKLIEHRFAITNQGAIPITITVVKPSCGCLRPTLSKNTLLSQEQAFLDVQANTFTQPGGKAIWSVAVKYCEAKEEKELHLVVEAILVAKRSISPANLILSTQTTSRHSFVLTETTTNPVEIRSISVGSGKIARVVQSQAKKDGRLWKRNLTLEVLSDCPEGRHDEVIHLHTNDPECPVLHVPFTVVKHARNSIQAAPARLTIQTFGNRPIPARIILLSAVEDKQVVVDNVETGHPAVTCTWAKGPGSRSTLRVVIEREKVQEQEFSTTLLVHTRQPEKNVTAIPIFLESGENR